MSQCTKPQAMYSVQCYIFVSAVNKIFFSVSTSQNSPQVMGQSIDGHKPSSLLFNFLPSVICKKAYKHEDVSRKLTD